MSIFCSSEEQGAYLIAHAYSSGIEISQLFNLTLQSSPDPSKSVTQESVSNHQIFTHIRTFRPIKYTT